MKLQFEQVHPESHESFNTISGVASDFKCPYHFHPELELTYIEHGHGTRIIGSQLADFYQGDIIVADKRTNKTNFMK